MQLGYPRVARYLPPGVPHPALPLGKEKIREPHAFQGGRKLHRAQLREHMGTFSLFDS